MTGGGWRAAIRLGGAAQGFSWKEILGISLRIALGIALLYFSLREVDWRLLGRHLVEVRLAWLAAALGTILLTTLVKVLRWRSLMRSLAAGQPAGLLRLGGAFVVGQAANILLPFRGGDVARVGWLALEEREGDRALAGAVTVALEKYLDLMALAALLLLLWPLLPIQALERSRGWWLPLCLLLSLLFVFSLWAAPRAWDWIKPRLERRLPPAWQERLARADLWVRSSLRLRTAQGWIPLAGWTVCIWLLMAVTNLLVMGALGLPVDARAAGLVLAMIYVGVAPALMPGNAGPFYFFAMLGLAPFGVAEPERIAFAVLLHALVTLPPLALAGVYLAASRWMGEESAVISVIIPAKDAEGTLRTCLQALQEQKGLRRGADYEVILVDDGSTDGTARLAAEMGAQVIAQTNAGPAAARNLGARAAKGEILAFTDADCVPAADWLVELIEPFKDDRVVGVKGAYLTRERRLAARFVQCEYAYKYERMKRLPAIDFIDTYSAAYRRAVFLENDGFDEIFPRPSVEDQEFSFRLARKGYRLVFQPRAVVYHRHDLSAWEYARRKFGIGYWKACMLSWLPEKTFNDSHTSPSQRWQILLAALGMACAAGSPVWEPAGWLALACLALFLLSALPFLGYIFANDPPAAWAALPLLLLRALATGFGLLAGFLIRPRGLPRKGPGLWERSVKRLLDVAVSLVGLAVSAPVILLAALAVRVDTAGPALFIQVRVGENGRSFRLYKLRTMVADAEARLEEVQGQDGLLKPIRKFPSDSRVTRVGRFLRRWSLDELPQFWNVLKGEMSLVGPRPEELRVAQWYSDEDRRRLAVKPGMTGPVQVSGRADLDMQARFRLELDYIEQYSLWKDVVLIARSVPAILSGKGAY